MANYFTHFSCLLDVGTHENAVRAVDLYKALPDGSSADDPPANSFDGFGGGAHVLDLATGETVDSIDTDGWLSSVLEGRDPYA